MDMFYSKYVVCGLFAAVVFFLLRQCYKTWKIYSKFPILHLFPLMIDYHVLGNVPKDIPFSGYVFQNLIQKCQQFSKEGLVLSYILRPVLLIFSEEPIKAFLNEKIAADKPPEYHFLEHVFGQGLITRNALLSKHWSNRDISTRAGCTVSQNKRIFPYIPLSCSNGERWRNHRKMLNPSFQYGMLKERVPLFNEHASALVKDLEVLADTASTDPLDVIKSHYFNALKESVFGLKQCEENKAANLHYFHLVDNMSSVGIYMFAHPWLQWKVFHYFSSSARNFSKMKNELFTFTKNVIREMQKLIAANETSNSEYFSKNMQKSLTYVLLQHHLNDPSFTFENLHAEVTTFMAAGYDTVSYSTMWCLLMLGLYPEVQEKAFNEVNSLSQNYISYEDSSNLTYLEAVIMETLRLYPTVPFFGRQNTEEVHFGKYTVPKNTNVGFFPYLWHRNSDIYPDPERFDPERFLNGESRNTWCHIPFAEGNRTCIGKKYALIEMKVFLAYILQHFKITSLDKREDFVLCWNVVLTPAKPLRMRIERRYT